MVQAVEEPTLEKTLELMESCDVVVATGGMPMVKSAYSSGKPSFGVGAGNVQVILDRDIDYELAADKVITGRSFDNGIICSGEQSFIYYKEDKEAVNPKNAKRWWLPFSRTEKYAAISSGSPYRP